ncbi:MAG: hypothetical protein CVV25_08850 [Ignavibacteriae bacterium HGW-Ignavibacteriae-4]|jgi:hypothetical protein|nr:MAG: hypothetical protein CVV25_08850 [Ignavibacteriae bacterium HGW-Ignavibacteriae-4]
MKKNQTLNYSLFFLVISASLLLLTKYFESGDKYLAFFDDDFYYYIQTIKQTFKSGFITFNGIVVTNGFHPLWFWLLTILSVILGFGKGLFIVVNIITISLSAVVFSESHKLLTDKFQLEEYYSLASSLFVSFIYLLIGKGGMEVIITIPLIIYLLNLLTKDESVSSFKIGLVYSLCFLSRLDSIILLILLTIYIIKFRKGFNFTKFLIGLIPSAFYLLSNLFFYHTLMPISGMAKQLKNSYWPVTNTIESLISFNPNHIIYSLIPIFCIFISIILLMNKRIMSRIKVLSIISILFPLVLILFNSIVSGWGFWPWYYYIFIPSQLMFFILFAPYIRGNKKTLWVMIVIFILCWSFGFGIFKKGIHYDNYNGAKGIQEFSIDKKGVYAMGDRAGLVSFLIENPLIQMEGLVMNKQFVHDLKSNKLLKLLNMYDVNYYIANNPNRINNSKWFVQDPYKIHPSQIVSSDTIYSVPYDSVIVKTWKYYIFKMK